MDLPFHTILTSPIFVFRVGPDGTEMRLPAALVSQSSPVLNRLINGKMKEAQNGVAEIADVEEATFACFGQWLYTGEYITRPADRTKFRSPSLQPVPWDHGLSTKEKKKKEKTMRVEGTWNDQVVQDNTALFNNWAFSDNVCHKRSKKQELWDLFTSSCDDRLAAPPRVNVAADYPDMTDELLSHAKLCCFADRYVIPALANLCLDNLRLSLIDCECQSTPMRGIAELLAFTASNFPPRDEINSENLRSVVLSFTVIIFELLVEDDVFQEILGNGGDIVQELLLLLQRRLD
ncbi:hypothetical protein LTR64_003768 [Lithohypha guttulata]|uniref:uncharacterized protein n=1 Tax=Lithohypha guttulata TaxID=1690604 RepID=UPI002DE06A68|nr:hypothetical protein LTR51_000012 [Lithohypha guttulata]